MPILKPIVKRSFLVICLLFTSLSASAIELMKWERLPLAIPLHVGQERVIFLDRNVRVGLPASIKESLRVQTANGTIYLRAEKPVSPTRIQLQDAETGELILLDIAAKAVAEDTKELEPVRIVPGEVSATHYGSSTPEENKLSGNTSTQEQPKRETPVPVVLTRYAVQSLYAPLRTVETVNGVGRVNIRKDLNLSTLLPTLPVNATPLAAWKLEDHFVTAVKLQNTSSQWVELDPRLLQGNFVAATFQHPKLGYAGTSDDTTVVYIVTRRNNLEKSLLPNLSQFDALVTLRRAQNEK